MHLPLQPQWSITAVQLHLWQCYSTFITFHPSVSCHLRSPCKNQNKNALFNLWRRGGKKTGIRKGLEEEKPQRKLSFFKCFSLATSRFKKPEHLILHTFRIMGSILHLLHTQNVYKNQLMEVRLTGNIWFGRTFYSACIVWSTVNTFQAYHMEFYYRLLEAGGEKWNI